MNKLLLNTNFIKRVKNTFFAFYKSKEIKKIFDILEKDQPKDKKIVMFVGGCVRNFILNKKIDDIDVATIFTPQEIKRKFENTEIKIIDTGIEHGSITIVLNKSKFEITTLRKDIKTDGRHAEIIYTDDWKEDSSRRDFTFNAIYLDRKGNFFDPQNGISDLKSRKIKFIGDPSKRITEDYLRIIRFIRFALKYSDNDLEKLTIEKIKLKLNGIKNLSKERVLSELSKIIKLSNFNDILLRPQILNIFKIIFPEMKYIERLEKIDIIKKNKLPLNFEDILAILLVDESNNHEYFCHKYKVSNQIKNILNSYSNVFNSYNKDKHYFNENLMKNVYFKGKDKIKKYIIFFFLVSNKSSLSELTRTISVLEKIKIPKFPYTGKYLINIGFTEGQKLGETLDLLEKEWVKNNYYLTEKKVSDIVSRKKN